MRFYKYVFLIMFIFSPSFLFSQILVPRDIDVFINGISILDETMRRLIDRNDNYYTRIQRFVDYMTDIVFNENIDEYSIFKTEYQEVLQIDPPQELDNTFRRMGWDRDGHKKYMTIFFGFTLLFWQEEYESTIFEVFLNTFYINDLEIIKKNMDDLNDAFMGWDND